jgi:uncharacterized protein
LHVDRAPLGELPRGTNRLNSLITPRRSGAKRDEIALSLTRPSFANNVWGARARPIIRRIDRFRRRPTAWILVPAVLQIACAHASSDRSWTSATVDSASARERSYHSEYLTMRDGVRIAVDVYLPARASPGERLPTILHQTRYFRSLRLRWLGRVLKGDPYDHTALHRDAREDFVSHGYAWVDVDVRGSGASFGTQLSPLSPEEIRDGDEVVNWIVSQPWSNGSVGALGVSYDGSAADFLLLNRNPHVKATAPLFTPFDAYSEVAFPGGVRLSWYTQSWQRMNAALDRNRIGEVGGLSASLFVDGVHPVDGSRPDDLEAALRDHLTNVDVNESSRDIVYRDDVIAHDPWHSNGVLSPSVAGHPRGNLGTIGVFSESSYVDDLVASQAAIYNYSGWFDGAYAQAAIRRFLTVPNSGSRLTLGPWSHGGNWNCGPGGPSPSEFDHTAELRRFFDWHLKGLKTGIDEEKPVHYFTMIEGKWKASDVWPVPSTRRDLFLSAGNRLEPMPAADASEEIDRIDPEAATGDLSRWNSLVGSGPVAYPHRARADERLLIYTSAKLAMATEVTGHPMVDLFVKSNAADGDVFVYLEDVAEDGAVQYVTEGMLRARHRKLSSEAAAYNDVVPYRTFERRDAVSLVPGQVAELRFDLQPTSYLFQKGHLIRVAIAGADVSHFAPSVAPPPTVSILQGGQSASHIELPVVPRDPLADAERLLFIDERFDAGRPAARAWWIGWLTAYSTLAIGQGIAAWSLQGASYDTLRPQLVTGALASAIGVLGVLLMPSPGSWATNPNDDLADAERRLERIASGERLGHSWLAHLAAALVNGAGALVLCFVFGRPAQAALSFVGGMGVAELQIFTQPTEGTRDAVDYHHWSPAPAGLAIAF